MADRKSKASHMRQKYPKELFKLSKLFKDESFNKFKIGDELTVLIEDNDWQIGKLADIFGKARNRLSEIQHTSQLYGSDMRDPRIPFSHYELARTGVHRFGWKPGPALKEIEKNGITQRRDATSHFAAIERKKRNRKSAALAAKKKLTQKGIVNQCHNKDCRVIARKLNNQSVKIAFLDLPYGQYGKYKDGTHTKNGAARDHCDNASTAEVIKLIDDLMKIMAKKMTEGGVMLLCRPGGCVDPLHAEITDAADKHGWDISSILTWDKGKTQLGDARSPYTFDSESIWVIHRREDRLENHDGSTTKTVLRFAPVAQRTITAAKSHLFIKPMELCSFLVSKHSFEGELIFDACGCSGNFSIAAMQSNRSFVYCETNKHNFNLGLDRISAALQLQNSEAG